MCLPECLGICVCAGAEAGEGIRSLRAEVPDVYRMPSLFGADRTLKSVSPDWAVSTVGWELSF